MGGAELVHLRRRYIFLLEEFLAAGKLGAGILHLGQGLGQIRLALLDDGLILLGLDSKEDLVHLHLLALGEPPLLEKSLDPCPQFHLVHGRYPAHEGHLLFDRLHDSGHDLDSGNGRILKHRPIPLAATGNQEGDGDGDELESEAGGGLAGHERHGLLRRGRVNKLFSHIP